eukprot:CAMPEP_0119428140 /NCGR_PEP_ID=MMETSP1335-20130426/39844_1 /TAXON_ID=259385 /ORGANISM="Chrysoculter rhomboideus, Strain RCC1486" /LENGTH=59 /DNA_ID=CAMNT_0007453811 /DNA_START=36 /DNA_END=212 /DNA_ORIENTATION=+
MYAAVDALAGALLYEEIRAGSGGTRTDGTAAPAQQAASYAVGTVVCVLNQGRQRVAALA